MIEEYGQSTTGDKATNISYQVVRKGRLFGPEDTDIDVNFEVPIPWIPWPSPGWPSPVHPSLEEGSVTNWDGTRTNELTRADKGEDATFTFTWYDEAVNGHVIDFFWNGTRVAEAQITFDNTDADHVPGQDQTVDIPWNYIKDGGNGLTVPVHYQVSMAGVENDQKSTTTVVDVNAIAVELPRPSFTNFDPAVIHFPGCAYLEDDGALKVDIPDLSGLLKAGDEITFVFTPMKGDRLDAAEEPIAAAIFTKDYVLGGADTQLTGFTLLVEPYVTHILPLYDENEDSNRRGRAKIQYLHDDGSEILKSLSLTAVTAFHSANESCEIPKPKP
jgi:hypothetical protein